MTKQNALGSVLISRPKLTEMLFHFTRLVRGEGGTKKDLIDCAKAIADSSEEVTRLAVQVSYF